MDLEICKDLKIKSLAQFAIPMTVLLNADKKEVYLLKYFYQLYYDPIKKQLNYHNPKIWLSDIPRNLFRHASVKFNKERLVAIDLSEIVIAALRNKYYAYVFFEVGEDNPEFWRFIYGYDEENETFSVLVNKKDTGFTYYEMEKKDLNAEGQIFCFGIFKLQEDIVIPEVCTSDVRNCILEYLNSTKEENRTIGIAATEHLLDDLDNIAKEGTGMELFSYLILKEHKHLMLNRIKYLEGEKAIQESIYNEYIEVCTIADKIYDSCKEYKKDQNINHLLGAKEKLRQMLEKEKEILGKI